MTSGKRLVLVIVLALAVGIGLVCIISIPFAIQAAREAARRDQTMNNLGQLKAAMEAHTIRAAQSAAGDNLFFNTYSGYFVSNKFEPDVAASFVVINNQDQFDKVFGVAMVMGDKSHRLPKDAFESNVVLAAIRRGYAVWEFEVEGVTVDGGVVELHYTATSKQSDSATFASPLIVSIPKSGYKVVEFVENGKSVKKLETGEP